MSVSYGLYTSNFLLLLHTHGSFSRAVPQQISSNEHARVISKFGHQYIGQRGQDSYVMIQKTTQGPENNKETLLVNLVTPVENQTRLGPTVVFEIDRHWVYTG